MLIIIIIIINEWIKLKNLTTDEKLQQYPQLHYVDLNYK